MLCTNYKSEKFKAFLCTPFIILSAIAFGRVAANGEGVECGSVVTKTGEKITLREDVPLSDEDFEKVHVKRLLNATFTPVQECQIKVCGFTSYTSKTYPGLIGSGSDYADCYLTKKDATGPGYIFNAAYNTSSIGCACSKQTDDCIFNCLEREFDFHKKENNTDCALLFQETDCRNCYFKHYSLKDGETFKTNNAIHIRSLVVRDSCYVRQEIPALKKLYLFENHTGIVIYDKTTRSNVKSAFQSEPETFFCSCDINAITTTTLPPIPSSTTSSTHPPLTSSTTSSTHPPLTSPSTSSGSGYDLNQIAIGMLIMGCISIFGVTTTFLIWKKRNLCASPSHSITTCDKLGLDGSSSGRTTTYSESEPEPDYSQILTRPYDSRFETKKDHFRFGIVLGEGHFGEVCKGTLDVAIKTVKHGGEDVDSLNSLQQEIKILSFLGSHENVVRILGSCVNNFKNGELYLITEFCEKGCLKSFLKGLEADIWNVIRQKMIKQLDISNDGYSEEAVPTVINVDSEYKYNLEELSPEKLILFLQWSEQIANGMQYITSKKIVHVDLAARNILLNHNLTAKIGDFGLARKIYIKDYESSRKESIPIRWVAPESLTKNKYSSKSDVWAYGVTVWEIFSLGKDPYDDKHSFGEILGSILKGERLKCPQFAPDDIYAKLHECWTEIPEDRASFEDLRDFFAVMKYDLQMTLDLCLNPD